MTSSSATGFTEITLQFNASQTIAAAAGDVQAAINAAGGDLPKTMPTPPTYRETNPADTPILLLALTSKTLPLTTVDDYGESIIAQKLSQVQGVGLVSIGGQQQPAMRVEVNPAQLSALGLTLEDVRMALSNTTVDDPKGILEGQTPILFLADQRPADRDVRFQQRDHRLSQWRADPGSRYRPCLDWRGG